jgi:cytochrome c5
LDIKQKGYIYMDFPLNKQTDKKRLPLQALALSAVVSLTVFLSGCTSVVKNAEQSGISLVSQPIFNQQMSDEDFAFPSKPPSLMKGREIFQQQCVKCHATSYWQTQSVKTDLAYTTPIDLYRFLTRGEVKQLLDEHGKPVPALLTPERKALLPKGHPAFKNTLNSDDRWAVIFYARYLAGAGDLRSPDPKSTMDSIFSGNCAVCHGSKGQGDGFLHTGKTGNHELHDAPQLKNLLPAPANFQQYSRIYNRTDAQLLKYLCEGIYPSAMPAWYGNVNLDKDTGKPTYIFDDQLLMNLVRYVRTWAYQNDLDPDTMPEAKNPPPGLPQLESCHPSPTNRAWTKAMQNNGPNQGKQFVTLPADPVTGGMTHVGPVPKNTVVPAASATYAQKQGGAQ